MAINKVVYGGNTLIDLTDATLGSSDSNKILAGNYSAYGKDGIKITGTCTFDSDTTDANASAGEILSGRTAYVNKNKITGTMPNHQGANITLSSLTPVTIPSGYYDGSGVAQLDSTDAAKIIASNIKDGVEILGVTGTYTGEGVTAQAKTVTPYTTSQTVLPDAGYDYLSQVTVNAIYYNETPNTYGVTVTIGTVAP